MNLKTIVTPKFPQLSYTVYGSGQAIILIHGFPLDGSIWHEVATEVAKKYMVIVPDLPGSGQSTFAGDTLSVEDMAESIQLILQAEGITKAIIAGHSMGGYAAMAFAELYPQSIAGLGMIHSTAAADTEEKKEQRRKSIALFNKEGGKDPFIRQMIPALFAESAKTALKEAINTVTELALLTESRSLTAFYNAMINRPDRKPILYNSKVPVMWAIGEDDSIIPAKNLTQQTSLSNVNFVHTYGNCGHMSMIEKPEDLIENFISFAAYCYEVANK